MKSLVTFLQLGRYGRFANQLYQIAGTIGTARKNNFEPAFPQWINHDHKERFQSTEDCDIQKHFLHPLPSIPGWRQFTNKFIDWGYHDIKLHNGCDWDLTGHMQSPKYFDHCFDEVKYYLTMEDEYPKNDYTAIHVRLGDYDDKYHPRLKMEYYSKAIDQFPKSTKFLLFSDDKNAAHLMLHARVRKIELADGEDYIDDFKLMKSCKNFIIGNSSYSAMAATLNVDAKVVAPSNWFGPSYTSITAKDIYCPGWIVL